MQKFFKTRYRIVQDVARYCFYKAQFRPWWSPIWFDCFFATLSADSTGSTLERAEQIAKLHRSGCVVKYLD